MSTEGNQKNVEMNDQLRRKIEALRFFRNKVPQSTSATAVSLAPAPETAPVQSPVAVQPALQQIHSSNVKAESEEAAAARHRLNFKLFHIHHLFCRWAREKDLLSRSPEVESYLSVGTQVTPEIEALLNSINHEAQIVLQAFQKMESVKLAPPPVDGQVLVLLTPDQMEAWGFVFPALYGGNPVVQRDLLKALQEKRVNYGIDNEALASLVQPDNLMRLTKLAVGVPAEPGIDGAIEEVIPHTVGKPHTEPDDAGNVDYQNLNWLVPVSKGDVICHIVPATAGLPGVTVTGQSTAASAGIDPEIPMGENTYLSEDGFSLLADTDGQIFYDNDKYRVMNIVRIDSDVDYSTGNIDAVGNVFIKGDVRDSFRVKATGDVNITGSVAGATVIAGGSIFVGEGIHGNMRGRLHANGDIHCRYIITAVVTAKGDVIAESIASSTVSCEGAVLVDSGQGTIIGGIVTSMTKIKAREVGNERDFATRLFVGNTRQFDAHKSEVWEHFKVAHEQAQVAAMQQKMLEKGAAVPEIAKALQEIDENLTAFLSEEEQYQNELEELREQEAKALVGEVRISKIHPGTIVRIGGITRSFQNIVGSCQITLAKDGDQLNVNIL